MAKSKETSRKEQLEELCGQDIAKILTEQSEMVITARRQVMDFQKMYHEELQRRCDKERYCDNLNKEREVFIEAFQYLSLLYSYAIKKYKIVLTTEEVEEKLGPTPESFTHCHVMYAKFYKESEEKEIEGD